MFCYLNQITYIVFLCRHSYFSYFDSLCVCVFMCVCVFVLTLSITLAATNELLYSGFLKLVQRLQRNNHYAIQIP